MGKITGFMEFQRLQEASEAPQKRLKNWREFVLHLTDDQAKQQAARCMDCGIPFCNNGCPVNNIIPDWNDLVYKQDWRRALDVLHSTNNFPEFTGRICPAPCEAACTLNINSDAVGIKSIEHAIIDKGWAEGLGRTAGAGQEDRQEGRGGGFRTRRHGVRAAVGARRPLGDAVRKRATASAACCVTASPISSWKSTRSTAASRRWKPRAWNSRRRPTSATRRTPWPMA